MTKIEPMSVKEIAQLRKDYERNPTGTVMCLILAWACERAEWYKLAFELKHLSCVGMDGCSDKRHWRTSSDWLNEVLDEIGFPHD